LFFELVYLEGVLSLLMLQILVQAGDFALLMGYGTGLLLTLSLYVFDFLLGLL
jgi:hypothetical protein